MGFNLHFYDDGLAIVIKHHLLFNFNVKVVNLGNMG